MKKVLALLLALVMVLGLAACATKEAPAKTDAPAPADTTITETTEQTPADATDTAESVTIKIWFHGSNVTPEASEKVMADRRHARSDLGHLGRFRHQHRHGSGRW